MRATRRRQDWFDQYGHLVISQGPFSCRTYDPPAQFAELDAFRDPTYPFTASDFDLGAPPTLSIDRADAPTIGLGQTAAIDVTVQGPARSALRYLLIDPASGTVVENGERHAGATPGAFTVNLGADMTGQLFPGLYRLDLAASSDADGARQRAAVDLEVTP